MKIKVLLIISISALLIGFYIVPHTIGMPIKNYDSKNNGKILYVGGSGPGNFTNIQDAIDFAINGDTVFVFDDSSPYFENLIINKSINLLGEKRHTTIIDGNQII